jgi:hypothetical protein
MSQGEANEACSREIAHTVAKYIAKNDTYECYCAGDRFWKPKQKRCSQSMAEAQKSCRSQLAGSEARYSQKKNDYLCYCPDGYTWNKNRTGCVQTAQSTQDFCFRHYPGTNAVWVNKIGEYRCFCPGNGKWDPQRKGCISTAGNSNQAQGSNCIRLAQTYMQQVNSFKSAGGRGSTTGLWNILQQARNCNWYFQEARNVKCLDLARKFDQGFVSMDPNNQHSVNIVSGTLSQAQSNGCSWFPQAKASMNAKFERWYNNKLDSILNGGVFNKDSWKVKNVPKINIPKPPKGGNLGGR